MALSADPVPAMDRRFLALLVVSVGLHAALLAWVRGPAGERPAVLARIVATLRLAAPTPSGSTAVVRPLRAPAALPQEARQAPSPREHRPARAVVEPAAPPATVAPAGEALPTTAPVPAVTAAAAQPAPSVRAQPALLDGYGRQLAELFARQQEYPRIAALRGWEGVVRVRLNVARKGNLVAIHLDRSSGFDVLDQHALAMLERFASLPPLPEGLEADEIQVVVPIQYKLKRNT